MSLSSLIALSLLTLPSAPPIAERERAVWLQPVGTPVMAAGGLLYIPAGATFPLTNDLRMTVEATLVGFGAGGSPRCSIGGCPAYSQLWLAAGPVFAPLPHRHRGFFVNPKLLAILSSEGASDPVEVSPGMYSPPHLAGRSLEVQAGADVGYQLSYGSLYLATMLGLSAGVCFNCADKAQPTSILGPAFWGTSSRRTAAKPAWAVNMNLFRVGYAF